MSDSLNEAEVWDERVIGLWSIPRADVLHLLAHGGPLPDWMGEAETVTLRIDADPYGLTLIGWRRTRR